MKAEVVKVHERDFKDGIIVTSGKNVDVIIEIPVGNLAGFLLDEEILNILPNYPYEIFDNGKKIFDGQTDENGYFFHPNLPSDYYELRANGESYIIPTLVEEDTPYQLRVLGEPQISADG